MNCSTFTKSGKLRNSGMFQPGVSGNPKGRPKKDIQVGQVARCYAPEAIRMLFEIALSPKSSGSDQVKALTYILDRAFE